MIFRTILTMLRSRRGARIGILDVTRIRLRVLPSDLDVLNHMNNGVYLSIADLGRFDLLVRSGIWAIFKQRGWYPVIVSSTITYRKSLNPWQRYELESRLLGFDDRAVYLEQRWVVGGEVYARAYLRGRFLKRAGGTVSVAELSEATGIDPSVLELPSWLASWSEDVALPSTRAAAPSDWA